MRRIIRWINTSASSLQNCVVMLLPDFSLMMMDGDAKAKPLYGTRFSHDLDLLGKTSADDDDAGCWLLLRISILYLTSHFKGTIYHGTNSTDESSKHGSGHSFHHTYFLYIVSWHSAARLVGVLFHTKARKAAAGKANTHFYPGFFRFEFGRHS